jgi:hypothetical protein
MSVWEVLNGQMQVDAQIALYFLPQDVVQSAMNFF